MPHTSTSNLSSQEGGPVKPLPKARPLALLLYSHFFPPSIGGVETIVLSLARGLAELRDSNGSREFRVTLVTQTPAKNFEDGALPFRVVRQPRFFQLWRLIRASDVIHLAGPALAPLSLGLLSGKPVVVEHHGFQAICPNGQFFIEPLAAPCPGYFMAHQHSECLRCNAAQGWFASWKLWLLTFPRRLLCARAAANITPTQWLGDLLHLPRVTAIPHGLDPRQAISRLVPLSGIPRIVFVGRLVTTKGVRLLLEAAKFLRGQNRRFQLVIIGDGPEREVLKLYASDAQLVAQVRFVGRLNGKELEATLAEASAVVVPSLGGEVFGLVVAENMLRALPVVASDLGAFVEVLGGSALTFKTGDAQDLAVKIGQLFDNPVLGTHLAQQARLRALDLCDPERMLHSHARLYLDLRSGPPSR